MTALCRIITIFAICVAAQPSNPTAIKGQSEKDLYDKLFKNYNKWIRKDRTYL